MSSDAASASQFETTEWSVVRQAASANASEAQAGLAALCRQYWYPLYVYIRRRASANDAEDLTQAFFAHLLTAPIAASADPVQGKFRAYVLACCRNFLANEQVRAAAQKRGGTGAATFVPIDGHEADRRYRLEPVDDVTPERHFDRQWAFSLLAAALRELEAERHNQGDGPLFQSLKPLLTASGEAPARYADIAAELNLSEDAVKKAAQRLRERYGEILRRHVAATCDGPRERDEEIRELFAALRA